MKVLVTGGRGFIGQHCLDRLLAKGYEVHAVSSTPQINTAGVQWHHVNLLDLTQIAPLLRLVKPSHLLHLAWYTEHGKYWNSPQNLNWVHSSLSLMREFSEVDGQRFVATGTCAEYDWTYDICHEFSTPCRPATLYGSSKLSAQLLLESWSTHFGLSSAWARIFMPYGPGENASRLVPSVIHSLLAGDQALCTHGDQERDFMYVEDVAAACVALLNSEVKGVVNIASGKPLPIKDVVYAIAQQLGRPDLVRLGAIPCNRSEPSKLIADISRLEHEVGFTPTFKLNQGIAMTVESVNKKLQSS